MKILLITAVIIFLCIIYVPVIEAEDISFNNDELVPGRTYSPIHYSLELVQLTEEVIKMLEIKDIQINQSQKEDNLNFISDSELLQVINNSIDVSTVSNKTGLLSASLTSPQIMIVPYHTGRIYISQKDIILKNSKEILSELLSEIELEITPKSEFNYNNNNVFSHINLTLTSEKIINFNTKIWIEKEIPHLLGIVRTTTQNQKINKTGSVKKNKKYHYFALLINAYPVEIFSLKNYTGAGSLKGLEVLFSTLEVISPGEKYLKIIYSDQDQFSLSGVWSTTRYKNNLEINFKLNQLIKNNHKISLMSCIYDSFHLGGETIYVNENDILLGLVMRDTVDLGLLKLTAGLSPLVYNFELEREELYWNFQGEINLGNFYLNLGYDLLQDKEYYTSDLRIELNSFPDFLLGYIQENQGEESYWLGLQFNL
ncbi:MAG: hypothetical protein ACOC4G_04020 [Bacillota bacterium]